ncbi:recombinase family protein [Methylobacterium organophilum]|jgi:DNA invertase Pin-like site-specific DNA recombinase|uniref:recombinase family protein n=1 Tax=Methylobacterium organophilum TaxID=410 RepID=UPI0019D2ECAF|nr:recombinase family protein [Methylobacterium organophilum]MBN6824118.1 recombinase family protein [Methylobacterium organophilum]
MTAPKFVVYLRSSARPKLEPDVQRRAVAAYLGEAGGTVAVEVIEAETGRQPERPQIAVALQHCRVHQAQLLIAHLGRLVSDQAFVQTLIGSATEFVALDAREANRHTIGILSVAAEYATARASARSKTALSAARDRGVQLGNPKGVGRSLTAEDRAKASRVKVDRARQRAGLLEHVLTDLRAGGASSLRELAAGLNQRGIPAARGGQWQPAQVGRVLALIAAKP